MKFWKFYLLAALFVGVSCGTDDSTEPDTTTNDNFDRGAMLVHWADNIIIPAYTSFEVQTSLFDEAVTQFNISPSINELTLLRQRWIEAYKSFQKVSMFEIGKAETLNYRNRLNVYPTNTQEIQGFITEGIWNFELPSTIDAQGFPAIDYMLNGLGTDEEIIVHYTTNSNADGYKTYLKSLSQTIKNLTSQVLTDWNTSFRDTYVSNTSSSASGAVDQTVNAYIFYYEKGLRAGKIGIPAGVFSSNPLPENVEALYKSDISKLLLEEALQATRNFFNGNGTTTGPSLKAYLDALNVVKNGSDLSTLINNQFATASNQIETLSNNFVEQITQDNPQMTTTFDELQRNVILIKVDMLQALSINVNYVDADGD
ncbi:iron-regulated protein A precursor [Patiriisocius marinistellae]|uniref:Iron-regulated protein A n=1 Tax=Patiriisocius marinistellae TaxID=2494560 RepID=A0A5J4G356_9FLAO|nr:imelysin family protein [Patiriisocius marinistellae]GEQ86731.1 iron-regulated protein A precursor [Patiriisocius marinistellae]